MARGRRWPKQDVDQWVEQWRSSGLTSSEFVNAGSLPISARTLRWHGQRHLSEALHELEALRALTAGCRVAERALQTNSPTPPPDRFIFDLEEEEGLAESTAAIGDCQPANLAEVVVAGSPAPRESVGQVAKLAACTLAPARTQSTTPSDGTAVGQAANSSKTLVPASSLAPESPGQVAKPDSVSTVRSPFIFDLDS